MTFRRRTMQLAAACAGVIATVGLAACGNDKSASTTATTASTGNGATIEQIAKRWQFGNPTPAVCRGKRYRIGIDYYGTSFSYGKDIAGDGTNGGGLKGTLKTLGCVDATVLVDNLKPDQVMSNMAALVRQKPDGIIMGNAISAAQPGAARLATRAGIPVISTSSCSTGVPCFQQDDRANGVTIGKAVAELFKKRFGNDTEPYVMVGGFPPLDAANQRTEGGVEGIESVLGKIPSNRKIVIDTKSDPAQAASATVSALSRVPAGAKVLLIGYYDSPTWPMFKAIKEKGHDVVGAAFGADSSGQPYVCDPNFIAVAQFPERLFDWMLPAIIASINGEKLPDNVVLPVEILTRDNLNKFYPKVKC